MRCSFCPKEHNKEDYKSHMIAGAGVMICYECVMLCYDIMKGKKEHFEKEGKEE